MSGRTLAASILALFVGVGSALAFEFNGRQWTEMPVRYHINPQGCPVLPTGETIHDLVTLATGQWEAAVCSDAAFEYVGDTDVQWAPDGMNTIFCVDQDWMFGQGAAGASLWVQTLPGEPLEVDLAMNAAELTWLMGGGDGLQSTVVDPVAVLNHELGHWLGMSHTPEHFATMYYAHLPNGIGADLAEDDRAGICTLYPSGVDECAVDADCPLDHTCVDIEGIPVCEEPHYPPGAFCSKDVLNCDEMCWVSFFECSQICLFTSADYLNGYCSPLCDAVPCPDGFDCTYLPANDVSVCMFSDPPVDGGDGDSGDGGDLDGGLDGGDTVEPDAGGDGDLDPDAGGDEDPDAGDGAESDAGADGGGDTGGGGDAGADEDGGSSGCGCAQSGVPGRSVGLFTLLVMVGTICRRRNS